MAQQGEHIMSEVEKFDCPGSGEDAPSEGFESDGMFFFTFEDIGRIGDFESDDEPEDDDE